MCKIFIRRVSVRKRWDVCILIYFHGLFFFFYILLLSTFRHLCVCPFPSPVLLSFPHLQVAIIAGNFDLAEIIKVHKASDVGKLTAVVVYHQATSVFYSFIHEYSVRETSGWRMAERGWWRSSRKVITGYIQRCGEMKERKWKCKGCGEGFRLLLDPCWAEQFPCDKHIQENSAI